LSMTNTRITILECLKKSFPDYIDKDVLKGYTKLGDNDLIKEIQYLKNEDYIELKEIKNPGTMVVRITFSGVRALSAAYATEDN
jgi:hypothetical protein